MTGEGDAHVNTTLVLETEECLKFLGIEGLASVQNNQIIKKTRTD